MHYYQFNIGDYSSHTKGLSPIEDLAYRRLIDEYYLSERPFNGCSTDVARLIGLREHLSEVEYVLNRYFTKNGDCWHHGRIDFEIQDYHQKQEKRSNAGKKSAEARQKQADVEQALNVCSTSDELTNNHKPLTINQEIKDIVPTERDSVPIMELVNLFNRSFETLPEVKVMNDKRRAAVRKRWLENKNMQTLEKWGEFFEYIKRSDFLMGRTSNQFSGLCFDWIFNPTNFTKIIEGNYHK